MIRLLRYASDIGATSDRGETALQIAEECNQPEVVALLDSVGARNNRGLHDPKIKLLKHFSQTGSPSPRPLAAPPGPLKPFIQTGSPSPRPLAAPPGPSPPWPTAAPRRRPPPPQPAAPAGAARAPAAVTEGTCHSQPLHRGTCQSQRHAHVQRLQRVCGDERVPPARHHRPLSREGQQPLRRHKTAVESSKGAHLPTGALESGQEVGGVAAARLQRLSVFRRSLRPHLCSSAYTHARSV